jgi:hypothetical protein
MLTRKMTTTAATRSSAGAIEDKVDKNLEFLTIGNRLQNTTALQTPRDGQASEDSLRVIPYLVGIGNGKKKSSGDARRRDSMRRLGEALNKRRVWLTNTGGNQSLDEPGGDP